MQDPAPPPPGDTRPTEPEAEALPVPPTLSPSSSSKILFGKYEVGRLLGCGAFAKVYHARHTGTGQSVALKVFSKPAILRSGLGGHVKREIFAMRRLRHPHILRLHEVLASRSKIYFVLELAKGGELFARVHGKGRLSEDLARSVFHQLLSAVAYSHTRGVFHRDLKPENLLLDDSGRLKVSDFGLAALADHPHAGPPHLFHTLCGTPAYVAPEILTRRGYDPAKADIWSCGVVLFVLVAGYLPFNDHNLMALYRKIYRGEYRCPRWASSELRRLLARLLDTDPKSRITIGEILDEPWFRKGFDMEGFRVMTNPPFHRDEIERKIAKISYDDEEDRDLNAFDIISFSPGFDLSGLFADSEVLPPPALAGRRERFISRDTAEVIVARLEAVAAGSQEGLEVRRRTVGKKGGRAGAAVEEIRTGNLVVWVEVYRLNRQLAVVEVETSGREEDDEFWREKLRPVLRCSVSEPVSPVSGSSRSDQIFTEDSSADWTDETGSTRSI